MVVKHKSGIVARIMKWCGIVAAIAGVATSAYAVYAYVGTAAVTDSETQRQARESAAYIEAVKPRLVEMNTKIAQLENDSKTLDDNTVKLNAIDKKVDLTLAKVDSLAVELAHQRALIEQMMMRKTAFSGDMK